MRTGWWSAVALALALGFVAEAVAQDAPAAGDRQARRVQTDINRRQRDLTMAQRAAENLEGEAKAFAEKTVKALEEYLAKSETLLEALQGGDAAAARAATEEMAPLRAAADSGMRDLRVFTQIAQHRALAARMEDNPGAAAAANKVADLLQRQVALNRELDQAMEDLRQATPEREVRRRPPAEQPRADAPARRPAWLRRPADDDDEEEED